MTMKRPASGRPRRRAARGASLVFAMITVVALSLAAVALVRSVDTGLNILGNLGFKQDTLLAADRATQTAIRWMQQQIKTDTTGLDASLVDAGYVAASIADLDPASTRTDAERVWILDPIDGTRSFIAGRPIFGTLIALTQAGWPTIGIIDQPIAQERWAGMSGQPTTFNGKPVFEADWNPAISANPYQSFFYKASGA